MYIYHILLPNEWETRKNNSFYEAPSLATEGFIHCSFEEQLNTVIDRYYSGISELVILKIDVSKLSSKLVAEPSTANDVYPHVYGPIDLESVIEVERRTNQPPAVVNA